MEEKFEYKTLKEVSEMSIEDQQKYLTEKEAFEAKQRKEEIEWLIADAQKNNASKEDIEKLNKTLKEVTDEVEGLLLSLKQSKEQPLGSVKNTLRESLEKKKEDLKRLIDTKQGTVEFEVEKAGAFQTMTDITGREQLGQLLPGVGQIPRRRTYVKDRIRVQPVSTEYIKYVDQETVVRDAKNVAGCAESTHTTKLTWEVLNIQVKKVRDMVDICIDMLDDYDFVEGEIRNLVDSSVQLHVDSQLLLGDGLTSNINGIASYSSTFAANNPAADYSASVQAATLVDLIVVAAAQISAFGQENSWMADTVYLNPRDYTLMLLLKDQNDNYIKTNQIKPNLVSMINGQMYINGEILVVKNPNVPANEFYIFDSMQATILMRKSVVVEFSFENKNNFEREIVTVKAYERLNLLVRNSQQNAFMHVDDIAAGIAAITIPVAP